MTHLLALLMLLATGAASAADTPNGRVTLESGCAVQCTTQRAKSTIYYTSYNGPSVPVPNVSSLTTLSIPAMEISAGLSVSHIAGPGNAYDALLFSNSGTLTMCVHGIAWSSGSRSGLSLTHGTISWHNTLGVWSNADQIDHCYGGAAGNTDYGPIAADSSILVASLLTSANGQVSMDTAPAAAVGGSNNYCGLFNIYNRVPFRCVERDSTPNWTATTTAQTPCNAGTPGSFGGFNRITFVEALGDARWVVKSASSLVSVSSSVKFFGFIGVGYDTTTAISGGSNQGLYLEQATNAPNAQSNLYGYATHGQLIPPSVSIGVHYLQCMQQALTTSTQFNGSDYMMFNLEGLY